MALFPSGASQIHFPLSLPPESLHTANAPANRAPGASLRPKKPRCSSRLGHLQAPREVRHKRVSVHNCHCHFQVRRPGSEKAAGQDTIPGALLPPHLYLLVPPPAPPPWARKGPNSTAGDLPNLSCLPGPSTWLSLRPDSGAAQGRGRDPSRHQAAAQAFHPHFSSEQLWEAGIGIWLVTARGQDRRHTRLYFTVDNTKRAHCIASLRLPMHLK